MVTVETLKPSGTAHIFLDERGRAWIDDTCVKVIEVMMDILGPDKLSPERIHEEYPHLSLAQIHAAMNWYHDHQVEYDAEIDRIGRDAESRWAAQMNSPVRQKLRRLMPVN